MIPLSMMQAARVIRANAEPLPALDGTTQSLALTLRGKRLRKLLALDALHLNDWQGRVALSDQPRQALRTDSINMLGWPTAFATTAASATPDPLGGMAAVDLIPSAADAHYRQIFQSTNYVQGSTYHLAYVVHAALYTCCQLCPPYSAGGGVYVNVDLTNGAYVVHGSGAPVAVAITQLAGGWWKIDSLLVAQASENNHSSVMPIPSMVAARLQTVPQSPDAALTYYASQESLVSPESAVVESIIITADALATLTDYTASATGEITLGQMPAAGAIPDWDGAARVIG